MNAKILSRNNNESVHILIFETGDEVVSEICTYVKRKAIRAARFTAIGALQSAVLAFFDWESREYINIPVSERAGTD